MAINDIYVIADSNTPANNYGLWYSSDAGSTWAELVNGLCNGGSASLSYLEPNVYFTHSLYNDSAHGYIGKHIHGTGSATKVDAKNILSLTSGNWLIGPIVALSSTEIYFCASRDNSPYGVNLYRFNGDWDTPAAGDFTKLGTVYGFKYARGIVAIDSNTIYVTAYKMGVLASARAILYWNGTSFVEDTSFPQPAVARGLDFYNDEVYACVDYYDGADWYLRVYKGTYGSWSLVTSELILSHSYPSLPPDTNGSFHIDQSTGNFYVSYSDTHAYLGIYDGNSWTQELIKASTPSSAYGVSGLAADQKLICETGSLYTWDGVALTSDNPTEFGTLEAAMVFDSSPYLQSGPTSKNNKYFTTTPLVWSIGDY